MNFFPFSHSHGSAVLVPCPARRSPPRSPRRIASPLSPPHVPSTSHPSWMSPASQFQGWGWCSQLSRALSFIKWQGKYMYIYSYIIGKQDSPPKATPLGVKLQQPSPDRVYFRRGRRSEEGRGGTGMHHAGHSAALRADSLGELWTSTPALCFALLLFSFPFNFFFLSFCPDFVIRS